MTIKLTVFASDINNPPPFWSPWLIRVPTCVSCGIQYCSFRRRSWVAQDIGQGHRIWTAVSPTLVTWHGTQRLLCFSTSEAAPSRNQVFDNNELKQATESYLENVPREFYSTEIKEIFDRCQKCIDVQGDYIEKQCNCLCHLYITLNCKTFWSSLVFR